jgi:hypothetical protein
MPKPGIETKTFFGIVPASHAGKQMRAVTAAGLSALIPTLSLIERRI